MVVTNQDGARIALVRGRSAALKGRTVIPVGAGVEPLAKENP
jgi:hypothetical protein